MRSRLFLGFCVAAGVACARPTLDEGQEDGGIEQMVAPGEDGGTRPKNDAATAPPKDADATEDTSTQENDAGDEQPSTDASTTKDSGGVVVEADCKNAPPPTLTKDLGNATLTNITVAGHEGYAVVAPGASVEVEYSYSVTCGTKVTGSAAFIGLAGAKSYACSAFACTPVDLTSPAETYTFTAPVVPGLYYIQGVADLTISPCFPTPASPKSGDTLQNVAAICVSD